MDPLVHHPDQAADYRPSQGVRPSDPRVLPSDPRAPHRPALKRTYLLSHVLIVVRPRVDRRVRPAFIPHVAMPNTPSSRY
jgi:hypothetical protein